MIDALDFAWSELRREIEALRKDSQRFQVRAERAETAGAMPPSELATAPLLADGAGDGDQLFITDGRKSGESAGAGTGVPAYYNAATNSWLKFSDDTAVTV